MAERSSTARGTPSPRRSTRRGPVAAFLLPMLALALAMPVLAPSRAQAEVTELGWPYPPTVIEGYVGRDDPRCDPTNKPGPLRLKEVLSFWWGAPNQFNPNWHIARPCSVSETSYHREGRALDFYVDYDEPRAQSIVDWMLATDEYGNRHAKARRWGIIEIIWQDEIWSADRASEGFRPCSSCGPHYDHIHFSFSRPGALKQTTWHTVDDLRREVRCTGGTVVVKYWRYDAGAYGTLLHVRSVTGPLGNYTTQAQLRSSPWRVWTANGPTTLRADSPVSDDYTARAVRGSCSITL